MNNAREYFRKFRCEVLTSKDENKTNISNFDGGTHGQTLESYLKNEAWTEDLDGETRVYLVKDLENQIALFFSLKCGLLYEPQDYFKLDSDKLDFVDMLLDALKNDDQEAINNYMESQYYEQEEMDVLYKIAQERFAVKQEAAELKDDATTFRVAKCFSAIELRHFCKNSAYESSSEIGVPMGFGLFWEVVVPKICEITDKVGCKYLYLFAADQTDIIQKEKHIRKLVQYYKNDLKFHDVQDMIIIKPNYDESCYGLVQEIAEIRNNREAVWEEFSDIC